MSSVDDLVTYLRLSPEFGGTRFGPFEGLEIRLGSNNERCHITLAEALGVLPEHARLIRQRDNSMILVPAERTATIFLWRPGDRRPAQVLTPTAVRPGDAFALVTQDGPRFIIELDALPEEIKKERELKRRPPTHRRRLSAASMAAEAKRQAWTRVLVFGPAQMAQRAWVYIRSGAIYQPRNIFLGVAILGGWIFGTSAMCSRNKWKTETVRLENASAACTEQLEIARSLQGDTSRYNFVTLSAAITGSTLLGSTLEEDSALREETKKKAKNLFLNSKSWDWLIQGRGRNAGDFANWREQVMKSDKFDPDTARLVVWLGAAPEGLDSEFLDREDSTGKQVCGRGTLKATFRQARQLGMMAQPDALILQDLTAVAEDKARRDALLEETLKAWMPSQTLLNTPIETSLDPIRQGRSACLYVLGEDDRAQRGRSLNALAKQIGKDVVTNLPDTTTAWSPSARVAKYWSADLPANDLTQKGQGIDFSPTHVGAVLDGLGNNGRWILTQTAETIAKAVVLPCLSILKGEAATSKKILGEENLPDPIACLVLDWRLRNEE